MFIGKFPSEGSNEVSEYVFNGRDKNRVFVNLNINQNHPRIKELLSQKKLEVGREFIISYGKIDSTSQRTRTHVFNEFNTELEIAEA